MITHKEKKQEKKKGTREIQKSQKTMNKMAVVTPYLWITTLNVNGLNPQKTYQKSGPMNKKTKI